MATEVTTVGTPTTTSTTPSLPQSTLTTSNAKKNTVSKRIEVENLATDLQKKLGSNWDGYQATISAFLVGKLSRKELTTVLSDLLTDTKMVRMHNQLLLANLANSLRDGPNAASAKSGFGANSANKKRKDGRVKVSSQYEKLKKDIMALPIRERHRIKNITRESGKQKMANTALTLTRQALLPKIPYVSDKEKVVTGNTVEWTQDITHALQSLLSTESYSLPDNENLKTRMLGIAREHGLTGNIEKDALGIAYLGLETYLKHIIESAIDTVRYRKVKYTESDVLDADERAHKRQKKAILTTEDMADTFSTFPFLVEQNGPLYRLHGIQLNDDTDVEEKTAIDSLLKPRNEVFKLSALDKIQSSPKHETKATPDMNNDTTKEVKTAVSSANGEVENGTTNTPSANGDGKDTAANGNIPKHNVGTKDELNWLIHDIISAQ